LARNHPRGWDVLARHAGKRGSIEGQKIRRWGKKIFKGKGEQSDPEKLKRKGRPRKTFL